MLLLLHLRAALIAHLDLFIVTGLRQIYLSILGLLDKIRYLDNGVVLVWIMVGANATVKINYFLLPLCIDFVLRLRLIEEGEIELVFVVWDDE